MKQTSPIKYLKNNKGFALIATILVMSLMMFLALSMLSLSSVESRSTQQTSYETRAKANARMALMIALGELQK